MSGYPQAVNVQDRHADVVVQLNEPGVFDYAVSTDAVGDAPTVEELRQLVADEAAGTPLPSGYITAGTVTVPDAATDGIGVVTGKLLASTDYQVHVTAADAHDPANSMATVTTVFFTTLDGVLWTGLASNQATHA